MSLAIPELPRDATELDRALVFAAAGWFVLPTCPDINEGKHPGSVLGTGWPEKTSRDPKTIAAWFAGTDYRVALHVGRSGAIVFDVDYPNIVAPEVKRLIRDAPYQATRPDTDRQRGHYVFAIPDGAHYGNGTGKIGPGIDIRGRNGVILVGGKRQWFRCGEVPLLPAELAALLPGNGEACASSVSDSELEAFLAENQGGHHDRPHLIQGQLTKFDNAVRQGNSRHCEMTRCAVWWCEEVRAGYQDPDTVSELRDAFVSAVTTGFNQRTVAQADAEFRAIMRWAVAQAKTTDLASIMDRVERDDPITLAPITPITPATPLPPPPAPPVGLIGAYTGPPSDIDSARAHLSEEDRRYQASVDALEAQYRPIEDRLWALRPSLAPVRELALAQMALPMAALAACTARALTLVPPNVVVDTGIGNYCPLNLFVVLVGNPGDGKDLAADVAEQLIPLPAPDPANGEIGVWTTGVAGGEALAAVFWEDMPDLATDKDTTRRERRDAACFRINEVSSLAAAGERRGSTLNSEFCKAYSGQTLGLANKDKTKRVITLKGTYRACAVMGAQHGKMGALFLDPSGVPERWAYFPATGRVITAELADRFDHVRGDPLQPMRSDQVARAVGRELALAVDQWVGTMPVPIPASARREIREGRARRAAGHAESASGHGDSTRVRLAMAFAILDHRVAINEIDWELSGMMMQISDLTREWARQQWRIKSGLIAAELGAADAGRAIARKESVAELEEDKVRAAMATIMRALKSSPNGEVSVNDMTKKHFMSRTRRYYAAAARALKEQGLMEEEPARNDYTTKAIAGAKFKITAAGLRSDF